MAFAENQCPCNGNWPIALTSPTGPIAVAAHVAAGQHRGQQLFLRLAGLWLFGTNPGTIQRAGSQLYAVGWR